MQNKLCSRPRSISPVHLYAFICKICAKLLKTCKHEMHMQNMQKYAQPTLLRLADENQTSTGATTGLNWKSNPTKMIPISLHLDDATTESASPAYEGILHLQRRSISRRRPGLKSIKMLLDLSHTSKEGLNVSSCQDILASTTRRPAIR